MKWFTSVVDCTSIRAKWNKWRTIKIAVIGWDIIMWHISWTKEDWSVIWKSSRIIDCEVWILDIRCAKILNFFSRFFFCMNTTAASWDFHLGSLRRTENDWLFQDYCHHRQVIFTRIKSQHISIWKGSNFIALQRYSHGTKADKIPTANNKNLRRKLRKIRTGQSQYVTQWILNFSQEACQNNGSKTCCDGSPENNKHKNIFSMMSAQSVLAQSPSGTMEWVSILFFIPT